MVNVFDILFHPVKAVEEAKTERSMASSVIILVVSALLMGISLLIFSKNFNTGALNGAYKIAILVFLLVLFLGLLTKLFFSIFSQQGSYFDGLTAWVYGSFVFSVGFLVASIASLLPSVSLSFLGLPPLDFTLILAILGTAMIVSNAVIIKSTMSLFETELLPTIVVLVILNVAMVYLVYAMVLQLLLGSFMGSLMGAPSMGPGLY